MPSEGALGLLRRIAERAQDRAAVTVRAVIAVAEALALEGGARRVASFGGRRARRRR
ncbi:MAG: hypothetical protein U0235_17965 [Polyangiaceae bacterium]